MRVLALTLVLTLTGCAAVPSPDTADRVVGAGWVRLPDVPLSPRSGPVVARLGSEVLVVGGDTGPPCPPNASCAAPPEYAADGAAYDPDDRSWDPLPDAPRGISDHAPHAVLGDRLFAVTGDRLVRYDRSEDRWSDIDPPATPDGSNLVAADDDRLVLVPTSDEHGEQPDRILDTRTGRWSVLPDDPLGPSFDRFATATPYGIVLFARELVGGGPADPPFVRAALLPSGGGAWQRMPASGRLGGYGWHWTGSRLVDATPGGHDGGEVNGYGRVIPAGGALDPATRRWSSLSDTPRNSSDGWPVDAAAGSLVASSGWVYDDADGSWVPLPRPAGGPEVPGSATWYDDTLLVMGGSSYENVEEWTPERVHSMQVWAYRLDL